MHRTVLIILSQRCPKYKVPLFLHMDTVIKLEWEYQNHLQDYNGWPVRARVV